MARERNRGLAKAPNASNTTHAASSASVTTASWGSERVLPVPVARSMVCCSSQEMARFSAMPKSDTVSASTKFRWLPR